MKKRLTAMLMAICMVTSMLPTAAFAAEPAPKTIVGFSTLEKTEYTLPLGTTEAEVLVALPTTLTATVATAADAEKDSGTPPVQVETAPPADEKIKDEDNPNEGGIATSGNATEDLETPSTLRNSAIGLSTVSGQPTATTEKQVAVNWSLAEGEVFSSDTAGSFTYTAKLTGSTYTLAEGIALPEVTVTVGAALDLAGLSLVEQAKRAIALANAQPPVGDGRARTARNAAVFGQNEAQPFIIMNTAHLAELATLVSAGTTYGGSYSYATAYYKLQNDIDLAGVTTAPIGTVAHPFAGYFDGNSKAINSLMLATPNNNDPYKGLFVGYTAANIKDLTVTSVMGPYAWYDANPDATSFSIGTAAQLAELAAIVNGTAEGGRASSFVDKTITLTADLDLSAYNTGTGWVPIGNATNTFEGTFDGNGKTVSSLFINQTTGSDLGLFGCVVGGTVKDLGVVDCTVSGNNNVGGVVGFNASGTVSNCYSTGNVSGTGDNVGGVVGYNYDGIVSDCYATGNVSGKDSYVGGVVGFNDGGNVSGCHSTGTVSGKNSNVGGVVGDNSGTVSDCYATGNVSGKDFVGGVVGFSFGTVSGCYSTGTVSGNESVGGVVGRNEGTVSGCYSTGNVSGKDSYVGGVVGFNYSGIVSGCYASGAVSGTGKNYVGGVVGYNLGTVSGCVALGQAVTGIIGVGRVVGWNNSTTAPLTNNAAWGSMTVNGTAATGGTATDKNGEPLADAAECVAAVKAIGFDKFTNADLPIHITGNKFVGSGTESVPYLIATAADLKSLATLVNDSATNAKYGGAGVHYKLTANLDLSGYKSGTGWVPIGNETITFGGTFDGNGKTVSSLFINQTTGNNLGLFGYVEGGTVKDLGVVDCAISGNGYYVGGVVGYNDAAGTVRDCYSTGTVSGNSNVGGVVGANFGTVNNCYSAGTVSGNNNVGGVVGVNYDGTVSNCVALGKAVTGGTNVGRVVGKDDSSANRLTGNAAWGDMLVSNNVVTDGTATDINGKPLANAAACVTAIKGIGFTEFTTADLPSHIKDNNFAGSGTEDDPYIIATAEDLAKLATLVNDRATNAIYGGATVHYKLTADLDLSGYKSGTGWTPIGIDYDKRFKGTFNGNGKTVSKLFINQTTGDNLGLFGDNDGIVKNLGVVDCDITGKKFVGGVAGINDENGGTVSNCYVTGTISGVEIVGGVVGRNLGTVSGCYSTGAVSGKDGGLGGVVGYNGDTVSNCYSTGTVSGTGYVGGVVGENNSTVSECYSTGTISSTNLVGGVVGQNFGTVSGCYSTGNVSCTANGTANGTGGYVGGVIGENNGTVSGCYATGTVSGTGSSLGGVVGVNTGTVSGCYATGTVSGIDYVGGVVGVNSGTVSSCYATGNVSGTGNYVGGVVGYNIDTVSGCYATGNVSGTGDYVGGVVGYNGGTVRGCVALGGSVTGGSDVGRVVGLNESAETTVLTSNYAWSGMTVNGSTVTDAATDPEKTTNGKGKSYTDLRNTADPAWGVFTDANGWVPPVSGYLPILKGFPDGTQPNRKLAEVTAGMVNITLQLDGAVWDGSTTSLTLKNESTPTLAYHIGTTGTALVESGSYTVLYGTTTIKTGLVISGTAQTLNAYTVTFDTNGGTGAFASQIVFTGDTAIKPSTNPTKDNLSFAGWYKTANGTDAHDFASKITATTTLYAHYTTNGSGGSGGGGGGSSSSGGGNTTTPNTKPEQQPPVTEDVNAKTNTDKDGNVTATVDDDAIRNAIEKAQKSENGSGIAIVINVKTDKNATSVDTTLSATSIAALIKAGVTEVTIKNGLSSVTLNLAALKALGSGEVKLTISKVDPKTLSAEARKAIGNRPVFQYGITVGGKAVTDFKSGRVGLQMPYTLTGSETAGNLVGVFVDGKGKVVWLENSSFNPITGMMYFSTNYFSVYGIGYKQTTAKFTDTAKHWAKNDIDFVFARGLLTGTSSTTFSPNQSMTKGMLVTALGRLAGVDTKKYQSTKFTDVKADAYYAPYVAWANASNIVNGTTATIFAPDKAITRQEMAVMLVNYSKTIGYKLPSVHAEVSFADASSIASWAKDAVKQTQMAGILMGKSGNKFDPSATATRAEVSAMLRRFVELVANTETAEGWAMNESGQWMYIQNGKRITGKKTIDGKSYTFDQYGVTTAMPPERKHLTYTVKKGDSFWGIAWKYKVSMFELAAVNGKTIFSMIYAGDELKVPQK